MQTRSWERPFRHQGRTLTSTVRDWCFSKARRNRRLSPQASCPLTEYCCMMTEASMQQYRRFLVLPFDPMCAQRHLAARLLSLRESGELNTEQMPSIRQSTVCKINSDREALGSSRHSHTARRSRFRRRDMPHPLQWQSECRSTEVPRYGRRRPSRCISGYFP